MPTVTPEVHAYEDDLPRHLGPPPVPNYTGKKLYEAIKPTYTVELDSGAFMALWEHMEAEAKRVYPTRNTYASTRAYLRAVAALRQAYWARHDPPPPPEKPKRRLMRPPKK
jgi:hypothetical protein